MMWAHHASTLVSEKKHVCLKRILGVSVSGRMCECVKCVPLRHLSILGWDWGMKAGCPKWGESSQSRYYYLLGDRWSLDPWQQALCIEVWRSHGMPLKQISPLNPSVLWESEFKSVKVMKINPPNKIPPTRTHLSPELLEWSFIHCLSTTIGWPAVCSGQNSDQDQSLLSSRGGRHSSIGVQRKPSQPEATAQSRDQMAEESSWLWCPSDVFLGSE